MSKIKLLKGGNGEIQKSKFNILHEFYLMCKRECIRFMEGTKEFLLKNKFDNFLKEGLKMDSMTNIALVGSLSVIPTYILVLTFVYFILNCIYMSKTQSFYCDNWSFREIDRMYKIYDYYFSEYVLYLGLPLVIAILLMIYLKYLNTTVNKDDALFNKIFNRITLLIAFIGFPLAFYLYFFWNTIQMLGKSKDNFNNMVNSHFNLDYIDYINNLPNCDACSGKNEDCKCNLSEKNSIENLQNYLYLLKTKNLNFSEFIMKNDMENAKAYVIEDNTSSNYTNVKIYDLVINAILTYGFIKTVKDNKYPIELNSAFFHNKSNVFLMTNISNPNIYNIDYIHCSNIFKSEDKSSVMVKTICNDCVKIINEVNYMVMKIKYKIASNPLPLETFLIHLNFNILWIYLAYVIYKKNNGDEKTS